MANIELNMCKENADSSNYLKIFDLVIGNPPYKRDLHLKILDEVYKHVKENGEIVWLAPITRLTDIRNIYNNLSIKKFNEYNYIFKNITKFAEFTEGEMFKIFQAKPQNKVGIFHVVKNTKNSNDISPDKFINLSDKLKNKIKNIMDFCIKERFDKNPKNKNTYNYKINIPIIHGAFYKYFSLNYEHALNSKSKYFNYIYFPTEKDRYNYWKFWTSDFGKFLISLWKIDTHVHMKYIPYAWWENEEEAKKFFDITDDEIAEIAKVTMTNDK